MKKVALFSLVISLAVINGCALLDPPRWTDYETKIILDKDNKEVGKSFTRRVIGFSHDSDGTSIGDWAYAGQLARSGAQDALPANNEYKGIIATTRGRDISVAIAGNGMTKMFFVKSGKEITGTLPPGTYTATCSHRERSCGTWTFHVRPNETHNYDGKEVSWFLVY